MTNSDVKRFESQRLTDEEDGGGRVTGNSRTISKTMKLTLPDNRQFFVIFDRSNGDPVVAQQVMPFPIQMTATITFWPFDCWPLRLRGVDRDCKYSFSLTTEKWGQYLLNFYWNSGSIQLNQKSVVNFLSF